MDLAAVSVATNTAFEMARAMQDEIMPLIDKNGGLAQLIEEYYETLCDCDIEPYGPKRNCDTLNLAAYDLAKVCLVSVMSALNGYCKVNDPVPGTNGQDKYVRGLAAYNGQFW
jgi:hypothetical protein